MSRYYLSNALITREQRAGKAHSCCECEKVINKGTYYQYNEVDKSVAGPYIFRQCKDCHTSMKQLVSESSQGPEFRHLLSYLAAAIQRENKQIKRYEK